MDASISDVEVSSTSEATGSSTKSYEMDEHGCLKVAGVYTGPIPQVGSELEQNSKNSSYDVSTNGTFKGEDGLYTGPSPIRTTENISLKNNSNYEISENGTFCNDGLYTGPSPILEESNTKNNTSYNVNNNGTFTDGENYTGPLPNESSTAIYYKKLYESQELQKEEDYEKLKKKQKTTLRHAGYRTSPPKMDLSKYQA